MRLFFQNWKLVLQTPWCSKNYLSSTPVFSSAFESPRQSNSGFGPVRFGRADDETKPNLWWSLPSSLVMFIKLFFASLRHSVPCFAKNSQTRTNQTWLEPQTRCISSWLLQHARTCRYPTQFIKLFELVSVICDYHWLPIGTPTNKKTTPRCKPTRP